MNQFCTPTWYLHWIAPVSPVDNDKIILSHLLTSNITTDSPGYWVAYSCHYPAFHLMGGAETSKCGDGW